MGAPAALVIAADNAQQLDDWDGPHGSYWAEHADLYDRSLSGYHPELVAAAEPSPGDRILDVGCGSGQLALDLVRAAPRARVVGVDLSREQLEVARQRAGSLPAEFLQADAQVHDFGTATYDLVVSRTGTMFFGDPAAAFANLASAATPGARLVVLVWRGLAENEWLREILEALRVGRDLQLPGPGTPGPFAQSDRSAFEAVLTAAGWSGVAFEALDRSIWLGHDADHGSRWMLGQSAWLLHGTDEEQRARATSALRALFAAHQTPDGVRLGSAAWLVRARLGG